MTVQIVVAGALICDGALLVAQRARPPDLAGRWVLPGGKVASGESDADALTRELREELGGDCVKADDRNDLVARMVRRGVSEPVAEMVVAAMECAAEDLALTSQDIAEEIEDVMATHARSVLDVTPRVKR